MLGMTVADPASRGQDRSSRLRPFAWMRRLTHRRSSAADKLRPGSKKPSGFGPPEFKKLRRHPLQPRQAFASNAAGPVLGKQEQRQTGSISSDQDATGIDPAESYTMAAPTATTTFETVFPDGDRQSKAGTSGTVGGGVSTTSGGANSTFSSPNHSTHSLSTTLTTIQSQPTSTGLGRSQTPTQHPRIPSQSSTYFSHQYPVAPVSALPAHMNPHPAHLPTTYRSATANNLLTDNASIITLASSSHRRQRRNSVDTDASIRPIRPSSNWGSRESLPLSVLSQNIDSTSAPAHTLSQTQPRPVTRDERGSVYSSSGVGAPVLSSERNSIYAGKSGNFGPDGANGANGGEGSMRSGSIGHGRNDSSAGSTGTFSNTWASAKENIVQDIAQSDHRE